MNQSFTDMLKFVPCVCIGNPLGEPEIIMVGYRHKGEMGPSVPEDGFWVDIQIFPTFDKEFDAATWGKYFLTTTEDVRGVRRFFFPEAEADKVAPFVQYLYALWF